MKEKHIAASILWAPYENDGGGVYIMHKRTEGEDNGEVGQLALYGGEIKKTDKTHAHAASRELAEESGLEYPAERFKWDNFIFAISERDGKELLTQAEIFSLYLPGGIDLENLPFRNGVAMTEREVARAKILGELSSVATAAFGKVKGI